MGVCLLAQLLIKCQLEYNFAHQVEYMKHFQLNSSVNLRRNVYLAEMTTMNVPQPPPQRMLILIVLEVV